MCRLARSNALALHVGSSTKRMYIHLRFLHACFHASEIYIPACLFRGVLRGKRVRKLLLASWLHRVPSLRRCRRSGMCQDAQSRDSSSFKCHDIMLKLKIRLSCFTLKLHHARLLLNKLLTLLSCPAKRAFLMLR